MQLSEIGITTSYQKSTKLYNEFLILEWFSFECRKSNARVITLANQSQRTQTHRHANTCSRQY